MRLFGYELSISRARVEKALSPSVAAWLAGGSDGGTRMMGNAYAQVVWVYRAVNALAEAVANIPWRFGTDDGRKPVAGRLKEFYERPHPLMNGFQYWETRVMWLMLRGECFRLPQWREEKGRRVLDHIVMADPGRFTEVISEGQLAGWRYQAGGTKDAIASQVFLPEEVWFERLSNPFDPWRGMSPLSVASVACASDYASGQYMRALMENNGDAGLIVRTTDPLEADQREQLLAALRERRRTMGCADRPLLLWGGAEVTVPKPAAADIDLLNHRKFTLSEICAAFGVPEEIMATVNAAKYDVMKGSRLNFLENRVGPLCRRLEAEEQKVVKLLEPRARGYFALDEHPIMAEARRERLKAAQAGFSMGIPLNDLNAAMELGFKPFPWGDVGYVPGNMRKAEEKDEG